MEVIFKNDKLIAVNKSCGMPVQPDKSGDISLLQEVENHFSSSFHMVNRIDRPVSGIVLFTDDNPYYNQIKSIWHLPQIKKEYIAITEGHFELKNGTLENKLIKGRGNKAIEHPKGRNAILHYEIIKELEHYSIVKINLLSGRFHQIRAQLAIVGHPIKGDVKYGARRKNRNRCIYLHCYKITLPEIGEVVAPVNQTDNLWRHVIE